MKGAITIAACLALFCGCGAGVHSVSSEAQVAQGLRRAGNLEEAEQAYENALNEPLTHEEWSDVREALCATRRSSHIAGVQPVFPLA